MMSRNLLPNIHRGLIAGGFITTAPVVIAFAALTVAAPAFAQSSLDSSSAPATDYALPPPDGGSLAEPSPPGEATPDDATPSDATSSATAPTEPSDAVKPVAASGSGSAGNASHSVWDRVGNVDTDTDSEDQGDQVLEVPQVLPPANPQPSDDADQTAREGGSQSSDQDPTPDQVGSIADYQDEEDGALMGIYGVPVLLGPVRINPFGVGVFQAPLNPGFAPGFVPMVPRTFAGGMNSAILPTSPMFPRGSLRFSGGMRRGRR